MKHMLLNICILLLASVTLYGCSETDITNKDTNNMSYNVTPEILYQKEYLNVLDPNVKIINELESFKLNNIVQHFYKINLPSPDLEDPPNYIYFDYNNHKYSLYQDRPPLYSTRENLLIESTPFLYNNEPIYRVNTVFGAAYIESAWLTFSDGVPSVILRTSTNTIESINLEPVIVETNCCPFTTTLYRWNGNGFYKYNLFEYFSIHTDFIDTEINSISFDALTSSIDINVSKPNTTHIIRKFIIEFTGIDVVLTDILE